MGVRLLEVALSDEHGESGLRAVQALDLPGLHVGAGTVTTVERARAAQVAGVTFLLTPHVVPDVNTFAAVQGSAVVELFPAGDLEPSDVKNLLRPYPDLKLHVVGGVDASNLSSFLQAGAVGAGIGGSLIRTDWNQPDWADLDARTKKLLPLVGRPPQLEGILGSPRGQAVSAGGKTDASGKLIGAESGEISGRINFRRSLTHSSCPAPEFRCSCGC